MSHLANLNNWTKNDLARVIAQALVNADEPLPADHFRVTRIVNSNKKTELVKWCETAIEALHNPNITA